MFSPDSHCSISRAAFNAGVTLKLIVAVRPWLGIGRRIFEYGNVIYEIKN